MVPWRVKRAVCKCDVDTSTAVVRVLVGVTPLFFFFFSFLVLCENDRLGYTLTMVLRHKMVGVYPYYLHLAFPRCFAVFSLLNEFFFFLRRPNRVRRERVKQLLVIASSVARVFSQVNRIVHERSFNQLSNASHDEVHPIHMKPVNQYSGPQSDHVNYQYHHIQHATSATIDNVYFGLAFIECKIIPLLVLVHSNKRFFFVASNKIRLYQSQQQPAPPPVR